MTLIIKLKFEFRIDIIFFFTEKYKFIIFWWTKYNIFFATLGIPYLVILDENNSIITKEGRMEVNEDPDGEVCLLVQTIWLFKKERNIYFYS